MGVFEERDGGDCNVLACVTRTAAQFSFDSRPFSEKTAEKM